MVGIAIRDCAVRPGGCIHLLHHLRVLPGGEVVQVESFGKDLVADVLLFRGLSHYRALTGCIPSLSYGGGADNAWGGFVSVDTGQFIPVLLQQLLVHWCVPADAFSRTISQYTV